MTSSSKNMTYKDAGVDIDSGNQLVDDIKPLASSTNRSGVLGGLGGFGGLFDLKAAGYDDPILVSATDGVGTKLKLALELNKHDTVGIDLVAMCVNDIVVQGAEPLFFLDYFATGKLANHVAKDVIAGISHGCQQAGCALIGGETAEMPGMYQNGEYDLAGFSVGAAEKGSLLPHHDISKGDLLIGMSSSGVHSNGFSLIRHVINTLDISLENTDIDGKSLGERLLEPTVIYVKSCLKLHRTGKLKALSHITGGGLTENLPRILPKSCSADIDLSTITLSPLFQWLKTSGNIEALEMLKTFNCGVGMVAICKEEDADSFLKLLAEDDIQATVIGQITPADETPVTYRNMDSFS